MNIIDEIKAMPRDLPLNHAIMHVERITVDDLIALAERHERLLEAAEHIMGLLILLAEGVEDFSSQRTRAAREELADAIGDCNTLL